MEISENFFEVIPIQFDEDEDSFRNEDMGSKVKFWFSLKDQPEDTWLLKFPRENTGEHWAEKIAEKICSMLGIEHAIVKLAEHSNFQVSISKNFVKNCDLYHGNDVLPFVVTKYDTDKKFKQSDHRLDKIFEALEYVFQFFQSSKDIEAIKSQFAEYLMLDALIGNTDRHHENWGLLIDYSTLECKLAPTFDHASSLGRELLDSKRERFLKEDRVGKYSRKGRGAVYWSENDIHGPAPLELVRLANQKYPKVFQPALNKLAVLDSCQIRSVVDRIPRSWMTNSARNFSTELMSYNLNSLKNLNQ